MVNSLNCMSDFQPTCQLTCVKIRHQLNFWIISKSGRNIPDPIFPCCLPWLILFCFSFMYLHWWSVQTDTNEQVFIRVKCNSRKGSHLFLYLLIFVYLFICWNNQVYWVFKIFFCVVSVDCRSHVTESSDCLRSYLLVGQESCVMYQLVSSSAPQSVE